MPISTEQAKDLLGGLITLIRTAKARSHRDGERSVSGTKTSVLRVVREESERLGDLANRLNVATSVVSRAVDALEHEGLAERRPDPQDARACLVTITDEGERRLNERERYVIQMVTDELDEWTPSEADQIIDLLQRLERHVSDLFEKFDQENDATTQTQIAEPAPSRSSPTEPAPTVGAMTTSSAPERTLENTSL